MDWVKSLRAFEAVVEAGGFAAAARGMGLSRAVVNVQVKQLESALGTQLLRRSTRKVTPTETGLAFYGQAQSLLADLDNAISDLAALQTEVRGNLRLNAPMTFGTRYLSRVVADFMATHPDIHVEFSLGDRFVDLIEEGYDVTLRIGEPESLTSLVTEVIGKTERVLCASPDYARSTSLASPDDLKHARCLHYGYQQTGLLWHLEGPDGGVSTRVNCVMWSNNGEVLRDAATNHQGVAMLPTFIVGAELQSGQLQRVMPEYAMAPFDIFLLYPRHRHLSNKVSAFVSFVKERFAGREPWSLVV